MRRQVLVGQNTLHRGLTLAFLLLSQDRLLEHLGSDLCALASITKGTRGLQESVYTGRRLRHSPEGRQDVYVIPGASKTVDKSRLVVLAFFYIVFRLFSPP